MKALVTIILFCASIFSQAQQFPIPIFQSVAMPTPFITAEGKVAFTLPKGHEPITDLTTSFRTPPLPGSDAFSSGIW